MATRETTIKIRHRDDQVPSATRFRAARDYAFHELCEHLMGLSSGSRMGDIEISDDASSDAVAADGTVTFSGAAGPISVSVNGVALAVSGYADDEDAASELVNAINESASVLVHDFVSASAVGPVVTVTAKAKGATGNAITLSASGTGASVSGARLTGGEDNSEIFTLSR